MWRPTAATLNCNIDSSLASQHVLTISMSRSSPEDQKERILNYLLQSDALRRDLKAQAARALRQHGASVSPLSRSVRLMPAAIQRELEVLTPLLEGRSQSLKKQRPNLRKLPPIPSRRKPAFCGCLHSQQPVPRSQGPEKPSKRRRRGFKHRLPPLKLFRPDTVLQRIYQPRQADFSAPLERRPATIRTTSPMRVKTSEALLTPILETQSIRPRKCTKSPIGEGTQYASRVTL